MGINTPSHKNNIFSSDDLRQEFALSIEIVNKKKWGDFHNVINEDAN